MTRFWSTLVALALSACGADEAVRSEKPDIENDAGGGAPAGWRKIASIAGPRYEALAAAVDGRVYFIGGIVPDPTGTIPGMESDTVEIYDPTTDRWTPGPPLPADAPRHHLAGAVLNGRLYVSSGFSGILGGPPAGNFRPSAATFVLEAGAWTRLADQPIARGGATAQAIGGRLYVTGGGQDEREGLTDLVSYDPTSDSWIRHAPMPTQRQHIASCATGGRFLVVGGWLSQAQQVVAAAQAYDPATDTWELLSDMPTPRGGLGAAALNGVCHVVGGETWRGDPPGTFALHEAFDPATQRWTTLAPMATARHGIGVTTLEGSLYVVGGGPIRGNSYTDEADVFTP